MKKIAIVGYGWVGKSMHKLFPDAVIYDPHVAQDKDAVNKCDVAFIGVPTPNIGEGKLDTSIVEECISWLQCDLIVVRSTVNPGDCDRWSQEYIYKPDYNYSEDDKFKNIVMQPEYLGETPNHPMFDPKTRQFIVMGGAPENRRKLIDLYATVYNANTIIRQVTALEAEIIKLTENRAIAFKVSQCQELFDVCELAHVDYYTIREAVYGDDPRFDLWWTFVFPEKRGFKSKCIPKDIYAWCAWAESLGYQPQITRAILEKNKTWIQ